MNAEELRGMVSKLIIQRDKLEVENEALAHTSRLLGEMLGRLVHRRHELTEVDWGNARRIVEAYERGRGHA